MGQMSYTFKLNPQQVAEARQVLGEGPWRCVEVPYAEVAVEAERCRAVLYASGKLLVQGRGAAEFVEFVVEPRITKEVAAGYEEELHPEEFDPHIGVDESGKGDFFGPLVVAAAYVDRDIARDLRALGARDSKEITSDTAAMALARKIRARLGEEHLAIVHIGPEAYNRMYAQMGSINRILAWGHARCIEKLLEKVPDCPRALSDQFGPERQIQQALMERGRRIVLEQHPRAESDVAVAAASILARGGFLAGMERLEAAAGMKLPKGAAAHVVEAGKKLVAARGGAALTQFAKVHFKTTDDVLRGLGRTRADEGLPPAPKRSSFPFWKARKPSDGAGEGAPQKPNKHAENGPKLPGMEP